MTELKNENGNVIDELRGIQKELKGIRKKNQKQVSSIILCLIIALSIGLGTGFYCGIHKDDILMRVNPKSHAKTTITVLEEKLEEEAKLNTGLYKQKSHYDSGSNYKKVFGHDIAFTGKSISFDYEGIVEAGVKDLSKAKVEVDANNGVVIITMPKIEITNISIDSKSITNTSETTNIFNQLSVQDFNNAYKQMEAKLKMDALNSDIIKKAQESAEMTLTVLFGDAINGYKVDFVWE